MILKWVIQARSRKSVKFSFMGKDHDDASDNASVSDDNVK